MKKNLIRVSFVLLLAVTIYLTASVLSIKSEHGVDQMRGMYYQPENSIDVVMMGTSHIHCDVNTGVLWEKFGIASYDFSGAEQPLWITYHYLKELYKYQTPKVVVIDMYAPARFKEDYQYTWFAENIHGMRFSLNKLETLAVSVEPEKIRQYFPSFAVYHGRYDELEEEDFENFFWDGEEKEVFKGYTPFWKRVPQQKTRIDEKRDDGLTPKSEEYLKKIISFTKEQGSELVLMVSPYIMTAEDQRTYNRIAEIAEKEGIVFINYNEYYNEIGIDFETDFNDESHLNYWGSCKFTEYLGEFLKHNGNIPDRRGQEGYDSWEDNVELIYKELENHKNSTLE